jgi:lipoyl(octanoyl) transferase
MIRSELPPVLWQVSPGLTPYDAALASMEAHVAAIRDTGAPERIWLLEHPPLYTSGTSASPQDLRDPDRFPVHAAGRGGQYTYHGPGQRVVYVMLDLRARGQDVRQFVCALEGWVIDTLAAFNVKGERRAGRVGVWVDRSRPGFPPREDKISALGIRLRRWVSFHGLSLNVEPDLSHFDGITPCGINDPHYGVTSLVDLGLPVTMAEVDTVLKSCFEARFGPVEIAS